MGKRITQQARGKGSLIYRVRPRTYRYKITYPSLNISGKAKVDKLINSGAHSAPIARISINEKKFYIPAPEGIYEGQEIEINGKSEPGNILKLKDIPPGTRVFNVESYPGSGGKYLRGAGTSGTVMTKDNRCVELIIKRRKLRLNENCRATVGISAGDGRTMKPIIKAGKRYKIMKSKGRKWHRTSAVKVNAIDHPFGGGRGKRIKSKIAKRNAPPGRKVGHIKPKKTGKRK
ncbi:50S ribosomal protein L2 [Candidatus Pacearchaeota archaeon]|nr:50S ribosomal protein L2 [Candidatus Pacearchaeota archaeon]MBD3282925.1 50S ribosomal protein L2 [Candidatus Pacearchaeota archaeon]